MTIQYTQQYYGSMGLVSPSIPVSRKSGISIYKSRVRIDEGFSISHPRLVRTSKVLQPFSIDIQRVEEGFIAASSISDIYELGETPKQAVVNYLYALIDEIMWFQDNKECISEPMSRDFSELQFHLGLV